MQPLDSADHRMMARWVVVGKVSGLQGLQGWVKVFSYTQPRHGIAQYEPLYLCIDGQWRPLQVEQTSYQGKSVLLKFTGYCERDAAAKLLDCDIAVRREQLPPLGAGEYYWADLEGLRVITLAGQALGTVKRLFETGANDVVVVTGEKERLIPFLRGEVIVAIDLDRGVMRVDWNPDF